MKISRKIFHTLGYLLLVEALAMVPDVLLTANNGELDIMFAFLETIAVCVVLGGLCIGLTRNSSRKLSGWESVLITGLSWVALCVFGALPFWFSGRIPHFIDALFEITSGFTTTGASVLSDVEALGHGLNFWRCFSHWIGGIGIIAFFLAILPARGNDNGYSVDLLKSESPGPSYSKIVPRLHRATELLFVIYIVLTLVDFILLKFAGMSMFDAACIAFGTAGTGGFAILNTGLATYGTAAQIITTIFMLLFGVNFSLYFMFVMGARKEVLKDEELRMYVFIVLAAILAISLNLIMNQHEAKAMAVKDAAFTVASVITTTGFSTADFNLWPTLSKAILIFLMFTGACAGSTAGGLKIVRLLVMIKNMRRSIRSRLYPNQVMIVRLNGRRIGETEIEGINTYLSIYVIIMLVSFLLISADPASVDLETSFTAVMATLNNIGPGLSAVGPTGNFGDFNIMSKLIMIACMLLGRLEIYPILAIFTTKVLRKF